MKREGIPPTPIARIREFFFYRPEPGGISVACWAALALLDFATLVVFRREMIPGEFGTLNTVLGILGLMSVPLLALQQACRHYPARASGAEALAALRALVLPLTEKAAWVWGAISLVLVFVVLGPLLAIPRFSILFPAFLVLSVMLGSRISEAACESRGAWKLWSYLLLAAAGTRLWLGWQFVRHEPWSEAALGAFLVAGLIVLWPAVARPDTKSVPVSKIWEVIRNPDFLLYLGATFSVVLGLFLFINADRLVAQSWFGSATDNNIGYVNWDAFDGYQTAGLLGRALLWGTQPLLWVFFTERSRLTKTTSASLTYFWIYLAALVLGVILLIALAQPLSWLFCGANVRSTVSLVPIFALAVFPLGLLQGLGVFALASRRYHECFVLGGCALGYTLLLFLVGRHPQLMPSIMFGGGQVALMIVLFVGVVRWGRKQP